MSGRTKGLLLLTALCVFACRKVREQPAATNPPDPPAEPTAPSKPRPAPSPSPSFAAPPPEAIPATSAPASPAAPAPETLNGDAKGLKREDLSRSLDGLMPSLANCFAGAASGGTVGLSFDADPSGRPQNIKVTGATSEAQRCVSSTLTGARLPTFEGKPVPVNFPITYQATAAPPPTTAPPSAPKPAPVFVNP